jgi:hypothetical protein
MTVIAWDGHMLAADKRATNTSGLARTCTKIVRHKDKLLAMTGDWDDAAELREWFKAGADPEKFPKAARDDKASLIVIDGKGDIFHYCRGPYPIEIEDATGAWGSGRDFALAAMYLGRSAVEAVRIACLFQSDCGSGMDMLNLYDVEEPST